MPILFHEIFAQLCFIKILWKKEMYKNRNTLQEIFETWILWNKSNNFSTPSQPRISLIRSFWLGVKYWLFLGKVGAIWYYWNRHRHYRAGLEDSTKFTAVRSDRTNRFDVLPAEIQMVLAQCTASRKRYWRQTNHTVHFKLDLVNTVSREQ